MRIELREIEVPEGESVTIKAERGKTPEVTVLGVDRREGNGLGNWLSVYRLALVWK